MRLEPLGNFTPEALGPPLVLLVVPMSFLAPYIPNGGPARNVTAGVTKGKNELIIDKAVNSPK